MGQSEIRNFKLAIISATVLIASCGGGSTDANEAATTEVDSNVMLEQLGNDASALEAAGNATPMEPMDVTDQAEAPASDPSGGNGSQPVLGETSGGDTGGNTVQGNGM